MTAVAKKPRKKRDRYEIVFRTDSTEKVIGVAWAYSAKQAVSHVMRSEGWQGQSVMKDRLSARMTTVRVRYTKKAHEHSCRSCGYIDPARFADRCPNCDRPIPVRV